MLPVWGLAGFMAFCAPRTDAADARISVGLSEPAPNQPDVPLSPTLRATATQAFGRSLTVSFQGRPAGPAPGPDFTMIALPDTQNYVSSKYGGTPAHFTAQTDWILAQRASRNVVFVTQLGDCVESGDNAGNDFEWRYATNAMYRLENPLTTLRTYGLPYGVAVGNHDQTPFGTANGTTIFYNQYFGARHFAGRDYYGGHYGTNNDNHYELFSASGLDFIIVHLEYDTAPNPAVLQWADQLLKTYSQRRAIVVSHWIINAGFNASFSVQGQAIYDALKPNSNLFLMLCGHVHPEEGQRTDLYNGNTIYTLLSDYQMRANGGDGWLRILQFSPSNNVIRVKTYSPTLGRFETDADSQFDLPYDMQNDLGQFSTLATQVNVPSGQSTSAVWPGLLPATRYEWRVAAADGGATVLSPVARFTTAEPASAKPGGDPQVQVDTDGDHADDAQEALAGTDPKDPTSVLYIRGLHFAPGRFELSWSSVTGKVYRVCFKPALDAIKWTDYSPEIQTSGDTGSWTGTLPADATSGFFTIRLVR